MVLFKEGMEKWKEIITLLQIYLQFVFNFDYFYFFCFFIAITLHINVPDLTEVCGFKLLMCNYVNGLFKPKGIEGFILKLSIFLKSTLM